MAVNSLNTKIEKSLREKYSHIPGYNRKVGFFIYTNKEKNGSVIYFLLKKGWGGGGGGGGRGGGGGGGRGC